MATVAGTIYLNGCNYQLQYDILSQSQANNTTTVRFYGVLNVTTGWVNWDTSKRAWVHYAESRSFGNYFTTGSYTLVQGDFTFTHDANGNKTQNVGFGIDTSFVSGSSNVDITFPHIDRFAILSSAQDFTDEASPKITFTKNVATGAKVYAGIFNSAGTTAYASYRDISSSVSNGEYTFNLTTNERNAMRNAIPNSNNIQVMFKLYTTISGTNFDGGSLTKTMTIVNANPTMTYTITETNTKVSALLGTSASTIVENVSNLRFNVSPTAYKGSSVLRVICGNRNDISNRKSKETSPYTIDIPVKSENTFMVVTYDTRYNSVQDTNIQKTMITYKPVAINSFSFKRQTETSSIIILNLSATYYQQTFGSTANAPIVKWKKDNGSWTTLTSSQYTIDNTNHKLTVSNLSLGDQVDYEHEATFTIYIEDKLSTSQNSAKVTIGIPTLELGKDDVKVNGTFETTSNAKVNGTFECTGVLKGGTTLFQNNSGQLMVIPFVGSSATGVKQFYTTTGFDLWSKQGTTSATGRSELVLGTNTASGTAGNKNGQIRLFSNGTGSNYIVNTNTHSNTYTNSMPAKSGTFAMEPVQLYNNASGTNGTVTLSETASNFQYIEIFFAKQDKYGYNSVKVYTGIDMSKVSLFTGYRNQGIHQLQYPTVKINGTSITKNDTGGCNLPSTVFTGNEIYIYRVVGYR